MLKLLVMGYLFLGIVFIFAARMNNGKRLALDSPGVAMFAVPFWFPLLVYLIFSRGIERVYFSWKVQESSPKADSKYCTCTMPGNHPGFGCTKCHKMV